MVFSALVACLAFAHVGLASYVLTDSYTPSNFFDQFDFFTGRDPTNGFVHFLDRDNASAYGLISAEPELIIIGVDSSDVAPTGRASVRLTSKYAFDSGLIILDLEHMPGGICGTWPAFWTLGPNWPAGGEINIIEGIHEQRTNSYILHTGPDCIVSNDTSIFNGTLTTNDCHVYSPRQYLNEGCRIEDWDTLSYGSAFNSNRGGIFITELNSSAISIWFFPRGQYMLEDVMRGAPDPKTWGKPVAQFRGDCDISRSFFSQRIIFTTTFCGDWAGSVWPTSSCASCAATCEAFVRDSPSAFREAYWAIRSLQIYQDEGAQTTQFTDSTSTQGRACGNPQSYASRT